MRKNSYSKRSKELTPDIFCDPNNFVNFKNVHPKIGDIIDVRDIVFDKSQLDNDKWFFCLVNKIELAKKCIGVMNQYNACVILQEEDRQEDVPTHNLQMLDRPLHIKTVYRSLDEFINNFGFDTSDELINKEANAKFKENPSFFVLEIIEEYKEGDEIWHHNDFGIAPKRCEREAILLVRNGKIITAPIIRMS